MRHPLPRLLRCARLGQARDDQSSREQERHEGQRAELAPEESAERHTRSRRKQDLQRTREDGEPERTRGDDGLARE